MLLFEKIENARKIFHERQKGKEDQSEQQGLQVEKNDVLAMLISAFLVFIPVVALILLAFTGVSYLLFLR